MIERREVWWVELAPPRGSEPGFRRPVLIIQADAFNRSRLQTALVAVLTSNLRLRDAPGNVLVPRKASGLPKQSVLNVTQVLTLDRGFLVEKAGRVPPKLMAQIDAGLKLAMGL